jgi:general secretion pathway protein G
MEVIENKTYLQQLILRVKKMKTRKGFTLVEILIVVVILGILAAIVIPQFTNASTEAKEANLKSNLQSVRSQIELYKIRHDDVAPVAATFETQMCDADSNGISYLQSVPVNPFSGGKTVTENGSGGDWKLDPTTNKFTAADGGTAKNGEKHADW